MVTMLENPSATAIGLPIKIQSNSDKNRAAIVIISPP